MMLSLFLFWQVLGTGLPNYVLRRRPSTNFPPELDPPFFQGKVSLQLIAEELMAWMQVQVRWVEVLSPHRPGR